MSFNIFSVARATICESEYDVLICPIFGDVELSRDILCRLMMAVYSLVLYCYINIQ